MRSKAFDEDRVLTDAMHLFRRQGFGATSVKDIEQATGLKTGSIYHSYGDKDGLFQAALAYYNAKVVGGRVARYLEPGEGIRGLRALFLSLLREPDGGSNGCLVTNSAIEFGATDTPALFGVHHGLDTLLAGFERVLKNAEVRDPAAVALRLLALYQGVLVLVRANYAAAQLAKMIDGEFSRMESEHDEP